MNASIQWKKSENISETAVTTFSLEPGKFSSLQAIHKYLFDEIYDFAGEIRTVNIAKSNFRSAPVMKGIDHSYYYEGYTAFKAEGL